MPGAKYPSSLLSSIRIYWTILLITKGKSNTSDPEEPQGAELRPILLDAVRSRGRNCASFALLRPSGEGGGTAATRTGQCWRRVRTCWISHMRLGAPGPSDAAWTGRALPPAQTLREASCPKKPARKPLA